MKSIAILSLLLTTSVFAGNGSIYVKGQYINGGYHSIMDLKTDPKLEPWQTSLSSGDKFCYKGSVKQAAAELKDLMANDLFLDVYENDLDSVKVGANSIVIKGVNTKCTDDGMSRRECSYIISIVPCKF